MLFSLLNYYYDKALILFRNCKLSFTLRKKAYCTYGTLNIALLLFEICVFVYFDFVEIWFLNRNEVDTIIKLLRNGNYLMLKDSLPTHGT